MTDLLLLLRNRFAPDLLAGEGTDVIQDGKIWRFGGGLGKRRLLPMRQRGGHWEGQAPKIVFNQTILQNSLASSLRKSSSRSHLPLSEEPVAKNVNTIYSQSR